MTDSPQTKLTMNGQAKQYHCTNEDCRRVLALVCGRVIQFPLIYGYTTLVELNNKGFFPITCECGQENKIRSEK